MLVIKPIKGQGHGLSYLSLQAAILQNGRSRIKQGDNRRGRALERFYRQPDAEPRETFQPQTVNAKPPRPAIASFFSFSKRNSNRRDPEEIATPPSVYDDPKLAPYFQPNPKYENLHRFDPAFRWKWGEEKVCAQFEALSCLTLMMNARLTGRLASDPQN
jgi:hypothetical protein